MLYNMNVNIHLYVKLVIFYFGKIQTYIHRQDIIMSSTYYYIALSIIKWLQSYFGSTSDFSAYILKQVTAYVNSILLETDTFTIKCTKNNGKPKRSD